MSSLKIRDFQNLFPFLGGRSWTGTYVIARIVFKIKMLLNFVILVKNVFCFFGMKKNKFLSVHVAVLFFFRKTNKKRVNIRSDFTFYLCLSAFCENFL